MNLLGQLEDAFRRFEILTGKMPEVAYMNSWLVNRLHREVSIDRRRPEGRAVLIIDGVSVQPWQDPPFPAFTLQVEEGHIQAGTKVERYAGMRMHFVFNGAGQIGQPDE